MVIIIMIIIIIIVVYLDPGIHSVRRIALVKAE